MEASADQARPKRNPVRFAIKLLVFIAVQLLIAFVLLEIVARVTNPLGISYFPDTAWHMDRVMIKEEPIGYRAQPGDHGEHYGTSIRINSLGLRDREIPAEPATGERRILVMGDSVPYGIGVEYEESIPHQLEIIANEHAPDGVQFRTINMGIPSYNTQQELIQLKSLGLPLQPQLVVLMFAKNDIEPKMWVFDKRSSWIANFAQRSYAASLLFVLQRNMRQKATGKSNVINFGAFRQEHPRWKVIDESMSEINWLCHEAGIPFVLFVGEPPGDHVRDLLDAMAAREGFEVATLNPGLDPRWRGKMEKYRNSPVDWHPNPQGCRIYAQVMAEQLAELGYLPHVKRDLIGGDSTAGDN